MLKFGALGLFGTNRETAFYKIIAIIGDKRFVLSQPDWRAITATVWRIQTDNDIEIEASKCLLQNYTSIVYQIHKYDYANNSVDTQYGYAV